MLPVYKTFEAHIYKNNKISQCKIDVGSEYSFTVKINSNPFVVIACSGSELEDLATGLLISEGIIFNNSEIIDIAVDYDNYEVNISTIDSDELIERMFKIHSIASGCGQGRISNLSKEAIKFSRIKLQAELIITSLKDVLASTKLHEKTRGVHSAALYTIKGGKIVFFDEIGRHNAVDKIIGYSYRNKVDLKDKMIISTGRLSSEIVHKAIFAGTPVIISKAAPTSLSVEMARKHSLTMIGKVSGTGFSIFSGVENIEV